MHPRVFQPGKVLAGFLIGLAALFGQEIRGSEAEEGGVVRDEVGEPVAGVTVLLRDTTLAAITAPDGSFELLSVPSGDYVLEARLPGYTVASLELSVDGAEPAPLEIVLIAVETPLDEIVVTASHTILREEPVSTVGLGREQISKLPHFGDDLFRAVTVLPGTSGGNRGPDGMLEATFPVETWLPILPSFGVVWEF